MWRKKHDFSKRQEIHQVISQHSSRYQNSRPHCLEIGEYPCTPTLVIIVERIEAPNDRSVVAEKEMIFLKRHWLRKSDACFYRHRTFFVPSFHPISAISLEHITDESYLAFNPLIRATITTSIPHRLAQFFSQKFIFFLAPLKKFYSPPVQT